MSTNLIKLNLICRIITIIYITFTLQKKSKLKNLNLLPAYLLTFINVLGFSIMVPVFPFIVENANAPDYVYGLILSIYSFFQFIGSPLLGKLSDSLGRKRVLIISHFGTFLSWVIFGIAYFVPNSTLEAYGFSFLGTAYFLSLPLIIIAFARVADGLTGGNISVTNAYISDVTTPAQKRTIFGYLGGIAGLAFIIGPGIGGLTSLSSIGYLGTVITAAAISLVTLFFLLFFLKESLPIENRREYKKPSIRETFFIAKRVKELNPKPIIIQILKLNIIMRVLMAFYIATIVLYIIDLFKFNEAGVGFFMLAGGLFLGFNQVFLYKKVVTKFGELKTLGIGFSLTFIGFIAITLTDNLAIYIALYYILNLGISLSLPVFNSLIAQHADKDKQGELMGISESISSLSNAIFPVISAGIFGLISYKLYYLVAILPLIGAYYTFKLIKKSKT